MMDNKITVRINPVHADRFKETVLESGEFAKAVQGAIRRAVDAHPRVGPTFRLRFGRTTMDKDQAAATLGCASDAYFNQPCFACDGDGEIVPDCTRPDHALECPSCRGSGRCGMPPANEIRRAAEILTQEDT